eukprot:gene18034-biopygen1326
MSESMIHGGMAAKPSGTAAQWRHSGGTVAARNGRLAAQWRHSLAARRHSLAATVPLAARRHSLAARRHGGTAAQPGGTAAQLGGTAARRHGGTVAAQWRHNLAARRHNWRHVCHWRHELAARRHGGTAAQWRQSQPCRLAPQYGARCCHHRRRGHRRRRVPRRVARCMVQRSVARRRSARRDLCEQIAAGHPISVRLHCAACALVWLAKVPGGGDWDEFPLKLRAVVQLNFVFVDENSSICPEEW